MKRHLLLTSALVFGFVLTSSTTYAESIDQSIQNQNQKIQDIEQNQKQLSQEVAQLTADIKQYQTQYEQTLTQKNKKEIEVNELNQKSIELADKIAKRSDKIRELARSTQMNQKSDSVLTALLEAESIGNFLSKSYAMYTFVQANQNLLDQQVADKNELEKVKTQATAALEKINEQITTLRKTNEKLTKAKLSLEVKQNELNASLAQEQAKKDQYIKQKETAEKAQQEALAKLKAQQAAQAAAQKQAQANQAVTSGNIPASRPATSGGWNPPLSSLVVTSRFGYREDPNGYSGNRHDGIDFAGSYGTPVYASRSGNVASSGYDPSAGNYVIIDHGDGYYSYYLHLSSILVSSGNVSAGQTIGLMGTTGNSTGVHLHFGIATTPNWRGFIDPGPILGV